MKITLSKEFDTYLIPEDEPEHIDYMAYCEKQIVSCFPDAHISYASTNYIQVDGINDPEEIEYIVDTINRIFSTAYDYFAGLAI